MMKKGKNNIKTLMFIVYRRHDVISSNDNTLLLLYNIFYCANIFNRLFHVGIILMRFRS